MSETMQMHRLLSGFFGVHIGLVLFVSASAADATTKHHHLHDDSANVFLGVEADKELATEESVVHATSWPPLPFGSGHATALVLEPDKVVHTGERTFWPPNQGNGLAAWGFAALFVILIAMVPCVLHVTAQGWGWPGYTVIAEGLCLVIWLVTGLLMFTHVFLFSSPHFGDTERTLTLVEAVYLFAQIITTVGYGDIIPAYLPGQIFVGFFVFCAIILIAGMVSEISTLIVERAEDRVATAVEEASNLLRSHDYTHVWIGHTRGPSIRPVLISFVCFTVCVFVGTCFYCMYPGEGKTFGQGLYMSIITLTTVGFGAFTAETEAGKVFGAFWMLIGVASLGAVVASFTEFMVQMKDSEKPTRKEHDADEILHAELKDHHGRVDKMHYMQYALLKYNIASKPQVDAILKQFDALDEGREGSVSVEKLQTLSSSPQGSPATQHRDDPLLAEHHHHGTSKFQRTHHHDPGSQHHDDHH